MLLERQAALDALASLREQAAAGPGRVALLGGEAGIGKTSLLREFARDALWGACDPLFTPRPLGPLHDMAAGLGGAVSATLAREAGRVAIFNAVLDALGRDAHCLVFEDVHWADEATLDLIAWLGRRIERTRTLLLASYRDDEIGASHPLRRVLGALPGAARLLLPRLSADAVRRLAGARAVEAPALHLVSGGNPFFVTELLAVDSTQGVPPTVRDAVLARIAPLPAAARAVLEIAAVLGPHIEPPLLEAVAGSDAVTLEACLAAGVLQDAGHTLEYRHELARQAVLGTLSSPRRQDLHRRVLQALRAVPGTDPARLAEHAEAAQDRDAVLDFAQQAARQALAVGARREAKAQYERALRWANRLPPAERASLLEAFAWECLAVGATQAGIDARRHAIALRAQLGEVARQAENLCRLTNLLINVGRHTDADEALRQAFDLLRPLPPCRELAYAWRTQAHLSMMRNDDDEAVREGDEAIALAERFGDLETLISALNSQGAALTHVDFEAGCAKLERSRQLAQDSGRMNQVFGAEINLGETALEAHRFTRGESHLAAAIRIAEDLQMDASPAQGALACCWLHLGRWNEAGDLALRVLTSGLEPRVAHVMARVALGRLRARRGDAGVWSRSTRPWPWRRAPACCNTWRRFGSRAPRRRGSRATRRVAATRRSRPSNWRCSTATRGSSASWRTGGGAPATPSTCPTSPPHRTRCRRPAAGVRRRRHGANWLARMKRHAHWPKATPMPAARRWRSSSAWVRGRRPRWLAVACRTPACAACRVARAARRADIPSA